jgi:hypothetical protein
MQQSEKKQVGTDRDYRLVLVEKAPGPSGAEGDNWCRYVLENDSSAITGWHRGSPQEVTQHARQYTEQLNARSTGAYSTWTRRREK